MESAGTVPGRAPDVTLDTAVPACELLPAPALGACGMPDLANTDKPLRIGLAGLGTVGGGLVELLEKNATLIRRRTGRNIELV